MPLMAETKTGKDFELPTPGTVQAVLAEVRDLGLVDSVYNGVAKKTHKVLFRWQLAELDSEKQPKRAYERFTLSLHEKAGLRKRIKQMFGKEPPTTLDVLTLVGTNAQLVIVHNENPKNPEKPFANIAAVLKLAPGTAKLEIVKIDPPKNKGTVASTPATGPDSAVTEANPIEESEIPW